MSTFSGLFASLPGVSCDRFSGLNTQSDQFFLSHCHADHMEGLDKLMTLLTRKNMVLVNHRIYCTPISKSFLLKKYSKSQLQRDKFDRYIQELEVNVAKTIDVYDKLTQAFYKLKVTPIRADHCPGSVMFLFEVVEKDKRILYTGDFRFDKIPLDRIEALHHPDDLAKPLRIDEMFLDTTFCSREYETFPSRTEAMEKIWSLVSGWIKKNGMYRHQKPKHVVLFHLPAQYGSEAILNLIYLNSNRKWKIHVSQKKKDDYMCTEDLSEFTSVNHAEALWIHACSWKDNNNQNNSNGNSNDGNGNNPVATNNDFGSSSTSGKRDYFLRQLPCQGANENFLILQIKPSAMIFSKRKILEYSKLHPSLEAEAGLCQKRGEFVNVCYSSHSSLEELKEFVRYFNPAQVFPNVVPRGSTIDEVMDLLRPFIRNSPSNPDKNGNPSLNLTISGGGGDSSSGSVIELSPRLDNDSSTSSASSSMPWEGSQTSLTSNKSRKRKMSVLVEEVVADARNQRQRSGGGDIEADSFVSSLSLLNSKRNQFKMSKRGRAAESMPAPVIKKCKSLYGGDVNVGVTTNKARRASLPHNLKIPEIRITPSSPSPDPNHPDYPEFYNMPIYLQTKKSSSESSTKRNETENNSSSSSLEVTFDTTTLRDVEDEDVIMVEDPDRDQDQDLDDTLELEDLLESVGGDSEERQNILKYQEGQAKRARKLNVPTNLN